MSRSSAPSSSTCWTVRDPAGDGPRQHHCGQDPRDGTDRPDRVVAGQAAAVDPGGRPRTVRPLTWREKVTLARFARADTRLLDWRERPRHQPFGPPFIPDCSARDSSATSNTCPMASVPPSSNAASRAASVVVLTCREIRSATALRNFLVRPTE